VFQTAFLFVATTEILHRARCISSQLRFSVAKMDASRKHSATLVSSFLTLAIEQMCVEWSDKKRSIRKTMAATNEKSDAIDHDERCAKGFIALRWLSQTRARLRLIRARLTAVKPTQKRPWNVPLTREFTTDHSARARFSRSMSTVSRLPFPRLHWNQRGIFSLCPHEIR